MKRKLFLKKNLRRAVVRDQQLVKSLASLLLRRVMQFDFLEMKTSEELPNFGCVVE